MRIAYVTLHLEKKFVYGGVGRKVRTHLRIWQEMGHEARLFLLSPDEIDLPDITAFRFSASRKLALFRALEREIARSQALKKLISEVSAFQPDIIYLRYGLFAFPLQRLFEIAPVVVEINTDDVREYRHRGKFFYWLNRLTRGQILHRAAGFVPISQEIAALPTVAMFKKPVLVLPNGIDLSVIEPLPAPNNATPRLAFVGNAGISWNGVDKLITFAEKVPDIQVDLIGYARTDIPDEDIPENVVLHGFVSMDKVREILSGVDVASGTLALHRKQLEENSALKVREALAYGLPIILAYNDSDVSGKDLGFILQLPNCEENVLQNTERIRDFIYNMVGKRAERAVVAPLIDQRVKEQRRFEFFKQILGY